MKVNLLKFHIQWLKILGLWTTKRRNFLGVIHTFSVIFLQILNLLSGATNMVQCEGKLACSLENATYTVLTLSGIYSIFIYLHNEKLYQAAVTTLDNLMNEFETYEYTLVAEKFTRKVATACTIYYSAGLLEYGISPLLDYSNCLKRNIEDNALTCGLPTPGWFPFNSLESPGYDIAFVFQCLCATLCIKSVVQPTMLCCSIIYHVIAQMNMLQDKIKKICDEEKSQERCSVLRHCVKHHEALLGFTELIVAAFSQLMLMHMILIAVILSVLGIEILQMFVTTFDAWNLSRYVVMFLGYLVILLCISIVGQKLIDESTAVADCAYNIPWYNESIEFQKMIQLIILRANKPLVLRSPSVSELSFQSFAKVMSSTYSYLTLLYKLLLVTED